MTARSGTEAASVRLFAQPRAALAMQSREALRCMQAQPLRAPRGMLGVMCSLYERSSLRTDKEEGGGGGEGGRQQGQGSAPCMRDPWLWSMASLCLHIAEAAQRTQQPPCHALPLHAARVRGMPA